MRQPDWRIRRLTEIQVSLMNRRLEAGRGLSVLFQVLKQIVLLWLGSRESRSYLKPPVLRSATRASIEPGEGPLRIECEHLQLRLQSGHY